MCFFAAKDSFQAFAHRLQWWIQSSYRTRRNNESRVEKEQSPYLGRPSSGAPDLEGKQEHSQQWTREHGKVVLSHWQKCFVTGICFLWDVCITEGNQRAFFNHWLECFGLRVTELQFRHWVLFYCVFFFCAVFATTENNKMLSNPTNSFNNPSVFIIFWLYCFENFAGRTSCPLHVKWCLNPREV